jgi:hypothetical protein
MIWGYRKHERSPTRTKPEIRAQNQPFRVMLRRRVPVDSWRVWLQQPVKEIRS